MHITKQSLVIHKRSHGFVLKGFSAQQEEYIKEFAKTLIQFGIQRVKGRFIKRPLKVFASSINDRSEYRFHIGYFEPFIRHLHSRGVIPGSYTLIEDPVNRGVDAPIKVRPSWTPRPEQEPAIEYIKRNPPPRLKLVEAQMGFGKSYITMTATADIGKRTLYIMRPAYMDKWLVDFEKTYVKGELRDKCLFIKGSQALKDLINMQIQGTLKASNIVISNKTFQMWLKDYETYGKQMVNHGWLATPDKFTEFLEVDSLVFDEVHQDFHLNFKIMSYAHLHQSISLSATLVSHDKNLMSIYNAVHPHHNRLSGLKIKRYTVASSYFYQFKEPEKIKTTEYNRKEYSHHVFERSVMRNPETLMNYFEMIKDVLDVDFISVKRPEQTALVFCSSIKMCQLLSVWLQEMYPNEKVSYYVQGGDYDTDFLQSTILVSTLGKSGTAVDKPDLRTVIMTNALDALAANLQALGRLRELKNGDVPRFVYFVNSDTHKHVEYHERKLGYYPKYVSGDIRTRYHDKLI